MKSLLLFFAGGSFGGRGRGDEYDKVEDTFFLPSHLTPFFFSSSLPGKVWAAEQ